MKPSEPESPRLALAEAAMLDRVDPAAMLRRALDWCAIQSGTGNLPGLARQAAALADACAALPGEVTLHDADPVATVSAEGIEETVERGRNLVLSVRPGAARRFLLTGHMDTVFPADSAFTDVIEVEPRVLNGPGLADMKGGIAVMFEGLRLFESHPAAANVGYDVMINSDEETGSAGSAALIARLAAGKHAALTYEPSTLPDGTFAGARGGSGNYSVVVTGRSAHAGRNPDEGRNALVAAAELAVRIAELGYDELSINPARIDGGSASNVVPDHAVLRFNIRPKTAEASSHFLFSLNLLIDEIAAMREVAMCVHGGITRAPKPIDERAEALFGTVRECSEALGLHYARRDTGGVCDGNNIAACGVPVVDTMGVRGGAIHSHDEYMIVDSLAERARLSALVLTRLALEQG